MKFLTLEDRYGLCEAVMFPKAYSQYGHLVKGYGPYLVTGTVQSRLPGEANLLVEEISVVAFNKRELEELLQKVNLDKDPQRYYEWGEE
jgi:DNA polymerase III alpha subunit